MITRSEPNSAQELFSVPHYCNCLVLTLAIDRSCGNVRGDGIVLFAFMCVLYGNTPKMSNRSNSGYFEDCIDMRAQHM